MNALVAVLVLAAAAVVLLLALRAHRDARALRHGMTGLQHDLDAQRARIDEHAQRQREWLAVMAHELRSPVSAVLGYSELLADGTLGTLHPRADDAVHRVQQAAEQLLRIIEGIDDMASHSPIGEATPADVSARYLLDGAVATLRGDAEGRGIQLIIADGDATLVTRADPALRAIVLALSAALKVSSGATLRLAVDDDGTALLIDGSRLDPDRDDPDTAADGRSPLTGAGLRIALARRSAAHVSGSVTLQAAPAGTRLRIALPSLRPADAD